MTPEQIREAIGSVENMIHTKGIRYDFYNYGQSKETILFALRFTEKVMGEPSEDMLIVDAKVRRLQFDNFGIVNSSECFKAMIQQACKEVGDDR